MKNTYSICMLPARRISCRMCSWHARHIHMGGPHTNRMCNYMHTYKTYEVWMLAYCTCTACGAHANRIQNTSKWGFTGYDFPKPQWSLPKMLCYISCTGLYICHQYDISFLNCCKFFSTQWMVQCTSQCGARRAPTEPSPQPRARTPHRARSGLSALPEGSLTRPK